MSYIIEKADEFKYIHRILNTNIDGKRRVPYALRIIRGIGRRFANVICKIARIDPRRRAGELSEAEVNKVNDIIADPAQFGVPKWFLNNRDDFKDGKTTHIASNNLDTKMRENLERLKKIRSHRGLRHFWGLRVRGQHTKTTGRRGATVGVTKKSK